jgi:hypothetical protein
MTNKIFSTLILLLALFQTESRASAPSKPLFEMTPAEIDHLLNNISQQNLTITERINYFSELFLGTPYSPNCTGDGSDALYEPWPLVNFQETNCMALCEHVLALSISDSWDNFFNNLQHIRYKDGIIGMRTRNHYTMADWLPENSWLLENVSRKIGGTSAQTVTRTISHTHFFRTKGITDLRYVLPDRKIAIDYLPLNKLANLENELQMGDILVLIVANKTDIFAAHMALVAEKNGNKLVRESSNSQMTTFETPVAEWIKSTDDSPKYLGLSILRVREELNQKGKIILPWEIGQLPKH